MESGMTELFSTLDGKLDSVALGVTELTVNMKSVIGNGQPGRLGVVEAESKEHAAVINKIKGALIVIGTLLTLLGGSEAYVHLLK